MPMRGVYPREAYEGRIAENQIVRIEKIDLALRSAVRRHRKSEGNKGIQRGMEKAAGTECAFIPNRASADR
jgi:hypothetical protein